MNIPRHLFLILASLSFAAASPASDPGPAPGSETFTLYEFAGSGKALGELDQRLRNDPRFKELGCERTNAGKRKHPPRYVCQKDGEHAHDFFKSRIKSGVNLNSTTAVCPTGCYYMRCPPPSGPYACCKIPGYQPC